MKCKLDENLGDFGRVLLTASGHDVSTVAVQGLSAQLMMRFTRLAEPSAEFSLRSTATSAKYFDFRPSTPLVSQSLTAVVGFHQRAFWHVLGSLQPFWPSSRSTESFGS
jgi:hypothetical protein